MYKIYADGACEPNPGKGGWAYVITIAGESIKEGSGVAEEETTNNRMEIQAVIEALKELVEWGANPKVEIYSDSTYVVNAFAKHWIRKWIKKDWKKGDGRIKNTDLWQELLTWLDKTKSYAFVHVLGHSGHKFNERCDTLANSAVRSSALIEDDDSIPAGLELTDKQKFYRSFYRANIRAWKVGKMGIGVEQFKAMKIL